MWKYRRTAIYCNKYSKIIVLKTVIDLATEEQRKSMAGCLRGRVIPADVGVMFFKSRYRARDAAGFTKDDMLPGDQVWFHNPYYDKLTPEAKKSPRYSGEEGSNVIYIGGGNVIGIYVGHNVHSLDGKRDAIRREFKSVIDWDHWRDPDAKKEDFQIRAIHSPVFNPFHF